MKNLLKICFFVTFLLLTEFAFSQNGSIKGKIIDVKIGNNGFGYDPIFVPDGYDITLAQMDMFTKNQISHRGKAFKKMAEFLVENKL